MDDLFNELDSSSEKKGKGRPKAINYHVQVPVKVRELDTSSCIPLRLDHKTIIFVKAGVDPEAVRAKFQNRDETNKQKMHRGYAKIALQKKNGPALDDVIDITEGLDEE